MCLQTNAPIRVPSYKITKVDHLLPWRWNGERSGRTLTAFGQDDVKPAGCGLNAVLIRFGAVGGGFGY